MHEEDLSTLEARCEILENNELIRNARSQGRSFGGKDPERRASANPSQSHSKSLTDERGHSPIRHHGHSPTRHHRHSPTRHHNHRNQKLDLAEVMTEVRIHRRCFFSSRDSSPLPTQLLLYEYHTPFVATMRSSTLLELSSSDQLFEGSHASQTCHSLVRGLS